MTRQDALLHRLEQAAGAPLPDDDADYTPAKARQAQAALQSLPGEAAAALQRQGDVPGAGALT